MEKWSWKTKVFLLFGLVVLSALAVWSGERNKASRSESPQTAAVTTTQTRMTKAVSEQTTTPEPPAPFIDEDNTEDAAEEPGEESGVKEDEDVSRLAGLEISTNFVPDSWVRAKIFDQLSMEAINLSVWPSAPKYIEVGEVSYRGSQPLEDTLVFTADIPTGCRKYVKAYFNPYTGRSLPSDLTSYNEVPRQGVRVKLSILPGESLDSAPILNQGFTGGHFSFGRGSPFIFIVFKGAPSGKEIPVALRVSSEKSRGRWSQEIGSFTIYPEG